MSYIKTFNTPSIWACKGKTNFINEIKNCNIFYPQDYTFTPFHLPERKCRTVKAIMASQ
jgi:hypothetical protein